MRGQDLGRGDEGHGTVTKVEDEDVYHQGQQGNPAFKHFRQLVSIRRRCKDSKQFRLNAFMKEIISDH